MTTFANSLLLSMKLMPLLKVDAMVDMRKLVDGWDFEAFPWSEA